MPKIKVAVIGAGAAGLCAARYLGAKPDIFEPVVFEKTGQIGGTWVYVDETGTDQYGQPIHSSMYKNLRTNLPKEVMAFPDFPFDKSLPSFIKHTDVLKYLEDYAEHFDVCKYIKFYNSVEEVSPIKQDGMEMHPTKKVKWRVKYRDVRSKGANMNEDVFESVIVCNGHYFDPVIPDIPGIDTFLGHCIHSHDYREPDPYQGKKVVIIGAGASGIDISIQVATKAEKVFLSHWNQPMNIVLPENVEQVTLVKKIQNGNKLVLGDGRLLQWDAIIFCTGYHLSFPFLTKECKVTVKNRRVIPLFMHLIHISYPSMSFVGIPVKVCPFPLFSMQVRYAIGLVDGTILPLSQQEMEEDATKHLKELVKKGNPAKYYHTLGPLQWNYQRKLCSLGNIPFLPDYRESIYKKCIVHRTEDLLGYKKMNFEITGTDSFICLDDAGRPWVDEQK